MKVGIVGVGASTNVGDGLIAACIRSTVKQVRPDAVISFFDFDIGRYDIDSTRGKPTPARPPKPSNRSYWTRAAKNLCRIFLSTRRRRELRAFCREQDIILAGGGHLLIDNYLYFPSCLALLAVLGGRKKLNYWCVGASGDVSVPARFMLRFALRECRVFVRDSQSRARLLALRLCSKEQIEVLTDPAIFSRDLAECRKIDRDEGGREHLLISLMAPEEMMRHSDLRLDPSTISHYWKSILNQLSQRFRVTLGCNGNPKDVWFVSEELRDGVAHELFVPSSYHELIEILAKTDVAICQRLHSCLPCISMGVPFIAFQWDTKVESILIDLGYEARMVSYGVPAQQLADEVMSLSCSRLQETNRTRERKVAYMHALERIL